MTSLMADPVDHWLDVDPQRPRRPLINEMHRAFDDALAADDSDRRAYWTGVGTGYAVGFGLLTREALDKARSVPGATVLTDFDRWPIHWYDDEQTAWACGVLYGYYQGTAEQDATECGHCGQRLVHKVDWMTSCHHGDFCEEHIHEWHAGGGFRRADFCTYLDGE